ncbi:MAG: hypothetical protein LBH55_00075 [Mycoplasmataceae bacterium]|jgi:hypothetical protein|nr:hypothetical protein [Mycoplasmataceae bacterium]
MKKQSPIDWKIKFKTVVAHQFYKQTATELGSELFKRGFVVTKAYRWISLEVFSGQLIQNKLHEKNQNIFKNKIAIYL